MKRSNLVYRRVTHIGQKLPDNWEEIMHTFIEEIEHTLRENNIGFDNIINMDETPVMFNMIGNKTLEHKGAKQVKASSGGQDKLRVSAVLTVSANGEKFAPLVIFRGKPGKKVHKEISKIPIVVSKQAYVNVQANAWNDTNSMKDWVKRVYTRIHNNRPGNKLLLIDCAESHLDNEVIDEIKALNTSIVWVPRGMTYKCQPLDIGINKPLKNIIRNSYNEYLMSSTSPKVDKATLLNWICNGFMTISSNVICNSFKPIINRKKIPTYSWDSEGNIILNWDYENTDENDEEMSGEGVKFLSHLSNTI
jgi:hypothetical protein